MKLITTFFIAGVLAVASYAVSSWVFLNRPASGGGGRYPSVVRDDTEYLEATIPASDENKLPRLPLVAMLEGTPATLSAHSYWNPGERALSDEEQEFLEKLLKDGQRDLAAIQGIKAALQTEILNKEIQAGRAHARKGKVHFPSPTRESEFIVRGTHEINYCVELNRREFPQAMEIRDQYFSRAFELHETILSIFRGNYRK